MKQTVITIVILVVALFTGSDLLAQCSICTKTASQLGETVGRGLNGGILYLAAAPLAIVSFIGYKWWKSNR